jgi:surface protein
MKGVFWEASSFNKDLNNWNTTGITDMRNMFTSATSFNQDISNWDVSQVTMMHQMFYDATSFNQNIGNWDVSNVLSVANVANMDEMFKGASSFNQNLSNWCVSSITSTPTDFATNSALAVSNYPVWGKEFSIVLTSGAQSQTVTASTAITNIVYTATTICSGTLSVNATGLPTGVTSTFNNNAVTISGAPNQSGTFNYSIAISGASTSQTVTGTLTVNSANATQSYTINVTAQNSSDYQLSGNDRNGNVTGNDPTVTINLGDTLTFNVSAQGHPFYLKTQASTGTGNQVTGATNQGTQNGTVTWTPTAAGTYYYICSLHGGMVGTITVN